MKGYYTKPNPFVAIINSIRNWNTTKAYIEKYGIVAVVTTMFTDEMLPPPLKCWAEPRGWARKHTVLARLPSGGLATIDG